MAEHIIHEPQDVDAWVCICGNTPSDSGFYPINEANHEVEPTPKAWTTHQYCCHECGRVIEMNSLEVVRRINPKDFMLLD